MQINTGLKFLIRASVKQFMTSCFASVARSCESVVTFLLLPDFSQQALEENSGCGEDNMPFLTFLQSI